MRPSPDDRPNVREHHIPAMHNILIGQPNHQKPQPDRDSVPGTVRLVLRQVVLTAIGFDDEAIADEEVDAPDTRNLDLTLQSDSGGPQSQSDHRLRTRLASGVAPLGEVKACKPRRCHNRSRFRHVEDPLVQHRVQHDDQPLPVETVRRRRRRDLNGVDRIESRRIQTVGMARANSGTRPACSCRIPDVQLGIGNPDMTQAQSRHATQYTPGGDGADDIRVGGRTGVPTPPKGSPTLRERLDLRVRPSCGAQLCRGHNAAVRLKDALDLHRFIAAHHLGQPKVIRRQPVDNLLAVSAS